METDRPWKDYSLVAFDTETSGAWPVGHDVVEFGAVKWRDGQEVDRLQILIKPRRLMSDFIIGIHGITNEMVANAPGMAEVVHQIHEFLRGSVLMAHHAPFDMGFLGADFETHRLPALEDPVLCTSLLSRRLIHGSQNHKLQTLIKFLGIDGGAAHRALDDARACLHVGLKCLRLLGEDAPLGRVIESQGKTLRWEDYSIMRDESFRAIVEAVKMRLRLEFIYDKATESRQVVPLGLVRNPDGDFMQAYCLRDHKPKRFYLAKVRAAAVIPGSDFPFPPERE